MIQSKAKICTPILFNTNCCMNISCLICNKFYMCETDVIWVILTVAEDGTMALTQQLSHLSELGAPPRLGDTNLNPFGPTSRQSSQTLFQVRPDKFCSTLNVKLLFRSYLLLCSVLLNTFHGFPIVPCQT